MRVVVLGDLHFIAPDDPCTDAVQRRRNFAEAWTSFQALSAHIRRASPDLVISLGDVVDWFSPQNRDFGLELLDDLGIPWVMTPGNHDFQGYRRGPDEQSEIIYAPEGKKAASAGWEERGIDLSTRAIDAGRFQLILMDSALSSVPDGTEDWLQTTLAKSERNLLFTHVPINLPVVKEYILQVDPRRDLSKYVQSGAPHLFERCLHGRVEAIFTAHLHFPGRLVHAGTTMHLLPLSIAPRQRTYQGQGIATLLDLDTDSIHLRTLSVDA